MPLFEKGHVPMIGEWVALPIWRAAGGCVIGDAEYDRILHPTAHRLLERSEGVLRLPGASTGADMGVKIAQARGIPVWFALEDVPEAMGMAEIAGAGDTV